MCPILSRNKKTKCQTAHENQRGETSAGATAKRNNDIFVAKDSQQFYRNKAMILEESALAVSWRIASWCALKVLVQNKISFVFCLWELWVVKVNPWIAVATLRIIMDLPRGRASRLPEWVTTCLDHCFFSMFFYLAFKECWPTIPRWWRTVLRNVLGLRNYSIFIFQLCASDIEIIEKSYLILRHFN